MNKDIAPIKKHPDAIAWDEYLKSPEGQTATNPRTLGVTSPEVYLTNRLWHAFQAGIKYAEGKK